MVQKNVQRRLGERSEYALTSRTVRNSSCSFTGRRSVKNLSGTTIVICGDTPLITAKTMSDLLDHHKQQEQKQQF